MSYVEPDVRRIVLVQGRDTAFTHRLRMRADDSIPGTVSASISAEVRKGSTVISTISPTWDAVSGAFTGTIPGSDHSGSPLDEDPWGLFISATVNGVVESFFRPVAFTLRELHPSVLISDLLEDYPELSSPLAATTTQLIEDRDEALSELDVMLHDQSVEMHRVRDRETLRQVLAVLIVATRYRKAGNAADDDSYREIAKTYKKKAGLMLGERLDYDADQNDQTDSAPVSAAGDPGEDFFFTGRRS